MLLETEKRKPKFLKNTLESIDLKNEFQGNKALRIFQKETAKSGYFSITSPYTGRKIRFSANYVMPRSGCIYWFDDVRPFCLISSSLRFGHPIQGLAIENQVFETHKDANKKLFEIALSFCKENYHPKVFVEYGLRPTILLGDINFAHFIWNELPGLLETCKHSKNFCTEVIFDPLGIMSRVGKEKQIDVNFLEHPMQVKGWQSSPYTMAESIFCKTAHKETILSLLKLPLSKREKGNKKNLKFYVTIREKGRTLIGQETFIADLVRKLLERYPNSEVFFDGFSFPEDYCRSLYDPFRENFEARSVSAKVIVGRIIENLPKKHKSQLKDITGWKISDSLRSISQTDYYISHSGTMQHKVAWFYSIPGTKHGNLASVSAASLKWHSQMVEGSIVPNGIPKELVIDSEVKDMPTVNDRNRDYEFRSHADVITLILNQIEATV